MLLLEQKNHKQSDARRITSAARAGETKSSWCGRAEERTEPKNKKTKQKGSAQQATLKQEVDI